MQRQTKKETKKVKLVECVSSNLSFHGRLVFCLYVLFKGLLLEGTWSNINIHILSPF